MKISRDTKLTFALARDPLALVLENVETRECVEIGLDAAVAAALASDLLSLPEVGAKFWPALQAEVMSRIQAQQARVQMN